MLAFDLLFACTVVEMAKRKVIGKLSSLFFVKLNSLVIVARGVRFTNGVHSIQRGQRKNAIIIAHSTKMRCAFLSYLFVFFLLRQSS